MRAFVLLFLTTLPGTLLAQELPRPVARWVSSTGTFNGSVKGERNEVLYNGDKVYEKIDCDLKMEFRAGGTVSYTTGNYFYEKIYYKKTTTGGYLVGHTRLTGMGGSGTRNSRLQVSVTQYDQVWDAKWQPRVDMPAEVLRESWREEHGKKYGYSGPGLTTPMVWCEPKLFWRGQDGTGAGLPLQGSYSGPDVVHPWATVTADWSFRPR
jgi:hypothetical protein